jgi:excisionase family DNA binding protein
MSKILTAKEIADYLRLKPVTVINLANGGDMPGFRIGKKWRFDMDDVAKKIECLKDNLRS